MAEVNASYLAGQIPGSKFRSRNVILPWRMYHLWFAADPGINVLKTKLMKLLRGLTLLFVLACSTVQAQQFGLSFSYFIPKNGYFSTPISPFSIRGLGFDINRFLAIETGGSLYRMSGLGVKDLPFETKDAIVGPNFTVLVP